MNGISELGKWLIWIGAIGFFSIVGYLVGVVTATAWEKEGTIRRDKWITDKRPGVAPGDRVIGIEFGDGRKVKWISDGEGGGIYCDHVPKATQHRAAFFDAWAEDDFDIGWILTAAESDALLKKYGETIFEDIMPVLKSVANQADRWHGSLAQL